MRRFLRTTVVAALALIAVTACADLEVVNPNDPDAGRALSNPDDVESLVAGALATWHSGFYRESGPGPFLSSQSFQHSSTPANFGMYFYSGIPRVAVVNDPAAGDPYDYFADTWYDSYSALAAVRDGLFALENDPAIAEALGESRVQRLRAFGKFVQGMAHATLATLFDQGFILDETTDVSDPNAVEPATYQDMMAAAMGYFDQAIALSEGASFEIPATWFYQTVIPAADLAEIAHSEKARFRPAVARTPEERAAVDWNAVIADVDAGVNDDYVVLFDSDFGWYAGVIDYTNYPGWSQGSYFFLGMADQSGNYQEWLATPLGDRTPDLASGPFVIVTPDTRFAQGTTLDEQRQNPGEIWMIPCEKAAGAEDPAPGEPCFGDFALSNMWVRAARGTFRWSYYWSREYGAYNFGLGDYNRMNEIDGDGQRLIKAEALYRTGDLPGAAALINVSRTAHGLNATDAAGTNTSCVPKLPDGSCGDLFEMLKWEKRWEARMVGLFHAPWYFDSRGWGDLYVGTQLQFPIPCLELNILERLPCYNFGGVGGTSAAAVSSYAWPDEG